VKGNVKCLKVLMLLNKCTVHFRSTEQNVVEGLQTISREGSKSNTGKLCTDTTVCAPSVERLGRKKTQPNYLQNKKNLFKLLFSYSSETSFEFLIIYIN
jgi:hypothetical protein